MRDRAAPTRGAIWFKTCLTSCPRREKRSEIDEYLTSVGTGLTNPAARAGLDDLHTTLEERATAIGEDAACAEMGDPDQFAAQLDAEFSADQPDEFDPPQASHLFGIPWNLSVGAGWGRRLFNSADDRVIVPHALGWAGH